MRSDRKKDRSSFATMLAELKERPVQKLLEKVPEWKEYAGELFVPADINAQQCSSSGTARYKAAVAAGWCGDCDGVAEKEEAVGTDDCGVTGKAETDGTDDCGVAGTAVATGREDCGVAGKAEAVGTDGAGRIADLTGGLGVDSWFFAQRFSRVLYCERNPGLVRAAAANFCALGTGCRVLDTDDGSGLENTSIGCRVLGTDNGSGLENTGRDEAAQESIGGTTGGTFSAGANYCCRILCCCHESTDNDATAALLDAFRPDVIYLDPARRSATGKKVFLLEDCEPDICGMLPMLLGKAPTVIAKVSPMADLTMLNRRISTALREVRKGGTTDCGIVGAADSAGGTGDISTALRDIHKDGAADGGIAGSGLREIHIVQSEGEVKELLLVISRRNAPGMPRIILADALSGKKLQFRQEEEAQSSYRFSSEDELQSQALLFEPGAGLLKAGVFKLICSLLGASKLSRASHLYLVDRSAEYSTADEAASGDGSAPKSTADDSAMKAPAADSAPEECGAGSAPNVPVDGPDRQKYADRSAPNTAAPSTDAEMSRFGKFWRIVEVLPLNSASLKALKSRYKAADVSARGIPMSSDELQKKLSIRPGGDCHIFGVTVDSAAGSNSRRIIVCRRA